MKNEKNTSCKRGNKYNVFIVTTFDQKASMKLNFTWLHFTCYLLLVAAAGGSFILFVQMFDLLTHTHIVLNVSFSQIYF